MAMNKNAKGKALTKSALFAEIAETTNLKRKDVAAVFDALAEAIKRELKKGAGSFTIPGLLKLKTVHKPAVKGGGMRPNPFKPGEMMPIKAKPARTVVKALALKNLKEMVK